MPYERNRALPKPIRDHLPQDAQTVYRKAYNGAWEQYSQAGKRRGNATREEAAHRVAWAAVKASYRKQGTRWVKKG